MKDIFDFAIIGGGASGLFSLRGLKNKKVVVIEGNKNLGLKLLATGGDKCNFTNLYLSPENFICSNPHFIKSFLAKFGTYDFLDIIEKHNIPYEERDNGKLFTLSGAKSILESLLEDGKSDNHIFMKDCIVQDVIKIDNSNIQIYDEQNSVEKTLFKIETTKGDVFAEKVIVASGGLSYPKLGATNIASKIAKKFGIKVMPMNPALAGIFYPKDFIFDFEKLSGIAITAKAKIENREFTDQLLFTHRGFSGPLALNLSLFVNGKTKIIFNFIPQVDVLNLIQSEKNSKKSLQNVLSEFLPKSLVKVLLNEKEYNLSEIKKSEIENIAKTFNHLEIEVDKLDGFDKAEVTRGGICVDEIFPKTMECRKVSGLYFIGEALDVTGMLGGYNLHWAWASAKMFIDGLEE